MIVCYHHSKSLCIHIDKRIKFLEKNVTCLSSLSSYRDVIEYERCVWMIRTMKLFIALHFIALIAVSFGQVSRKVYSVV